MFFDEVLEAAPDPIFGLVGAFKADPRPHKINLMAGVFKDEHLRSELLPIVKQARDQILAADQVADYLPIDGIAEFNQALGALVFGKKNWKEHHGRIYASQAAGGTGAIRVGAELLARTVKRKVYIPHPTWPNHRTIFETAGLEVGVLNYYNREAHGFDEEGFLQSLKAVEPNSIVVFHAVCHNPTGSDPTFGTWKQISKICKERSLLPFFDCAYQGLGEGVEEDAKPMRLFLEEGHELCVAYSCSKNFSLYCQRVGAFFAVCSNPAIKLRVGSQVKWVIRGLYSNPPSHGARIALKILTDPNDYIEWEKQIGQMRHRIATARNHLIQKLAAKAKQTDFSFLKRHKGMFSYLDLTKHQVQALIDQYGVYTLDSGRINVAGLTEGNTDYVVNAILSVCEP